VVGVDDENPEQLAHAFAAAIARRDVDGALAFWRDDAAIVAADGSLLRGREQIGRALQELVRNGTDVSVRVDRVFEAAGIALATGALTLSGDGADGHFEQQSDSTVVYVRGADGGWRIAIDAPWGLPRDEPA
jgi:uncharacterized protein (TIGR02246 family)